jgi:hypothetical protein
VWVDGWQMECCGDPFAVGSAVQWTVLTPPDLDWLSTILGDDAAQLIDAAEEHHGGDHGELHAIEGAVRSINAVFCRYEMRESSDALYPVDGSGVLMPLSSVPRTDRADEGLNFVGYLVDLDVVAIGAPSA